MARISSVVVQPFIASRTESGSASLFATVSSQAVHSARAISTGTRGRSELGAQAHRPGSGGGRSGFRASPPTAPRARRPRRSRGWPNRARGNAPFDRRQTQSATATIRRRPECQDRRRSSPVRRGQGRWGQGNDGRDRFGRGAGGFDEARIERALDCFGPDVSGGGSGGFRIVHEAWLEGVHNLSPIRSTRIWSRPSCGMPFSCIWVDRRRGERGQLEIAAGPEAVRRPADRAHCRPGKAATSFPPAFVPQTTGSR